MKVIEDINKLDTSKIGYRDIFDIIINKDLYEVIVYYHDEIILVKNLKAPNCRKLMSKM